MSFSEAKKLVRIVVCAAVATATTPAVADTIASFHLGGGTFRNDTIATGWRFAPLEDITVTQLGLLDENQDGLAQGHNVGLFEVANPGVALATAFIDNADALDGDSRFEAVAPVELLAGVEYYILADNWLIDRFVFGASGVGFAAEIDWHGYTLGTINSIFSAPIHGGGFPGDLGPTFQFTPACLADVDDSGTVDVDDLVAVILDWGTDGSANGGDVDGSGLVDVDDLLDLLVAWGPCP
jgi:hypothetical protein